MPRATPSPADSPRTLADRLDRIRRARFVGRRRELDTLIAMIEGRDPCSTLFVHGPGGIGKTTLLAECARAAEQRGRSVVALDARHIEPTPAGFRRAVHAALGEVIDEADAAAPPAWPESLVLLVDTLERIASLERWLLEHFLPTLPADALIVLAGRKPPGLLWRVDPGWWELARQHRLDGLADAEADSLLEARNIAPDQRAAVRGLARGSPLVLTLIVDALQAGRRDVLASPHERRLLFRSLTERFAADVPSPLHERALQVLMFARVTTEAMLAEAIDAGAAPALYDWLRSLSFVEEGDVGLLPHDLVRETYEADWFGRDAAGIEALRLPLMRHIGRRLHRLGSGERQRLAHEWIYLVRDTPVFRFLHWDRFDRYHDDTLQPGEATEVLAQTARALGPQSCAAVRHWLVRQPEAFHVARAVDGRPVGYWLDLDLTRVVPEDAFVDPVVGPVLALLAAHAPLPAGAGACATRFAIHDGNCAYPSETFDLAALASTMRWMGDTRLAWSVVIHPEAERLDPLFSSFTRFHWHRRVPALDVELDGRTFGAYVRDWRAEPNPLWQLAGADPAGAAATGAQRAAPDRETFAVAVRDALKHYARDDRLQASPLLDTELLRANAGPAAVEALRALLRDAIDALTRHPRDQKFHHALRLTWLDPGESQEQVARELGLPFNTYRYHLQKGLERITQSLWQAELLADQRRAGTGQAGAER